MHPDTSQIWDAMIRHMNLLMAIPSDDGPVAFAAKKAEWLPVEGLRLYFPAGTQTRSEHIGKWLKRLNRSPLDWVQPSVDRWTINVDGAKQRFSEELKNSLPQRADFSWPDWLCGEITLSPEFESGKGFAPRLAFLITEWAIAKAKNSAKDGDGHGAAIYFQQYFGEVYMGDIFQGISNSTIVSRSTVEEAFNRLQDSGQGESAQLLIQIGKLVSDANNAAAGAVYSQMANEISKPTHDKSVLKSCWDGLVAILPPLANLSAEVVKAFTI